jgi:hypothetical protein
MCFLTYLIVGMFHTAGGMVQIPHNAVSCHWIWSGAGGTVRAVECNLGMLEASKIPDLLFRVTRPRIEVDMKVASAGVWISGAVWEPAESVQRLQRKHVT